MISQAATTSVINARQWTSDGVTDNDQHDILAVATSAESSAASARCHVPQHVCSTCRRTFASRRNLVRHQQTHSGEKPFSCAKCGTLFTQACSLRRHELLHANESRWSCCQCGRSFAAANLLTTHLLKAHGNRLPGSSATSSTEPQLLNRASSSQWQQLLPLGECHSRMQQQQATGMYSFSSLVSFAPRQLRASAAAAGRHQQECACHACDKVLADVNSLKRHLLACHVRLRPHECGRCGQCFSRQDHLKKHQQRSIACCISFFTKCSSPLSSPTSSEPQKPSTSVEGEAAAAAGLPDFAGYRAAAQDVDNVSVSANGQWLAVLPQVVVDSRSPPTSVDSEERPSDTMVPTVDYEEPLRLQLSVDNRSPTRLADDRLHSVASQFEDGAATGHCRDSSMAEESEDQEEAPIADRNCSRSEYIGHGLPENIRSGEIIARFIRSPGDGAGCSELPVLRSSLTGSSERQQHIAKLLSLLSSVAHSCERCHRTFSSASSLILHEQTSHRQPERSAAAKELLCDRCGSCLSGSGSLKRHALRHLGEKPHACRICSRAFRQASCLKRHVLACHLRARPHECGRCGRRFSRIENMKLHQRSKIACKLVGAAVVVNCNSDETRLPLPVLHKPFVGRNAAAASSTVRVNGCCFSDNARAQDFGESRTVGDEQWASDNDAASPAVSGDSCRQVLPFTWHRGKLPEAAYGDCEDRPTEHTNIVPVDDILTMSDAEGFDHIQCGFTEIKKEVLPRQPLLTSHIGSTSEHIGGLLGGETLSIFSHESFPTVAVRSSTALAEGDISASSAGRSVNDEPSVGSIVRYIGNGDTTRSGHSFPTSPLPSSSVAAVHRHATSVLGDDGLLHDTATASASDCPRHACEQCGRTFRTSVNLRRHRRTHTGEKPYLCDVCGRQFSESYGLRRHARLHTGERPHECRSCGRRFSRHWNLKAHELTHNPSQKPHACFFCRATFARRSRLEKHVASCLLLRQLAA